MRTLDSIPEPKARQVIGWLLIANAVVWLTGWLGADFLAKLISPYL